MYLLTSDAEIRCSHNEEAIPNIFFQVNSRVKIGGQSTILINQHYQIPHFEADRVDNPSAIVIFGFIVTDVVYHDRYWTTGTMRVKSQGDALVTDKSIFKISKTITGIRLDPPSFNNETSKTISDEAKAVKTQQRVKVL